MEKRDLKFLMPGLFLMMSLGSISQHVSFTYDAAGNRTGRDIILLNKEPANEEEDLLRSSAFTDSSPLYMARFEAVKATIAPNPVLTKFSVKLEPFSEAVSAQLYLHTMTGTPVFGNEQLSAITQVDISEHDNGAYVLTLVVNGKKQTWKLIKQ